MEQAILTKILKSRNLHHAKRERPKGNTHPQKRAVFAARFCAEQTKKRTVFIHFENFVISL